MLSGIDDDDDDDDEHDRTLQDRVANMTTPRKKSTVTPGATTTATPAPNQLNKQASSTTGIYQQSVLLRSRLARIPDFAPFLAFSQSGPRASLDVVSQLWQTFAFGVPLCALYNLLGDSKIVDIGSPDIGHLQDLSMNDRKRAVAKFIMAIGTLKDDGHPDDAFPTPSITEVVTLQDTNGFVKLVACLLRLLDRLPEHVWLSELEQSFAEIPRPDYNTPSKEVRTPQEVERANIIRELIETERKYVQDLEVMLVCVPKFSCELHPFLCFCSRMHNSFGVRTSLAPTLYTSYSLYFRTLPTLNASF